MPALLELNQSNVPENMNNRLCNLCSNAVFTELGELHGRKLVKCDDCGLVFFDPLPTADELSAIYNDPEYFELEYFATGEIVEGDTHSDHQLYALEDASPVCSEESPLLDIGPGKGALLKQCKQRGVQAEGLEFSEIGAEHLRKAAGLMVHGGSLEDLAKNGRKYGAVTAFDVIEHCTDPMEWLESVHKVLKGGGKFYLSTMTVDNLLDRVGRLLFKLGLKGPMLRLYPEFHLYYFDLTTLKRYLEQAGFEVLSQVSENYSPQKATKSVAMRMVMKCIYIFHDITGKKTNQYLVCVKR